MSTTIIKPNIQMVDLKMQYQHIKEEVDAAVLEVIKSGYFINGPAVKNFQAALESYLNVKHVIPVANGTDALQVSLMALGLEPGDEVIVPAFTYVATAEVIALLRLTPVMVEVDPNTFNTTAAIIEQAITPKTKAIVPVHLYGQSSDMEDIIALAKKHDLYIIEDNAQAIGSDYTYRDGSVHKTGTMGDIGCTSFYPSKNLGAYGDAGAIFTNDDELAKKIRMVANHGQVTRYYHDVIGVNSRLDSIQAAILHIKLKRLDQYAAARQAVAAAYDEAFKNIGGLNIPKRQHNSTHVFHQYTLKVTNGRRDELRAYLSERGVPNVVYYPLPLYQQKAFAPFYDGTTMPITEELCNTVLSLPMHTEMDNDSLQYICETVKSFFK